MQKETQASILNDLNERVKGSGNKSSTSKTIEALQTKSSANKTPKFNKNESDHKVRKWVTIGFVVVLSVSMLSTVIGSFFYNWHLASSTSEGSKMLKPIDISSIISFILGQLFGIFGTIITYYFNERR